MNTLPLDPYGNSKLIIPRSNSTSDLFNVGNFIPSCTVNTPTSNSNSPNINNKTNTNTNHLRRNHSINYSSMTNNNININNYNGRSADQPTRQYQYKKRFDQVNNNIPLNNTNNNNLQYTNGQTLRRSNTTISRSNSYNNNNNNNNSNNIRRSNTGNYQNSNIVPSKNSNDLHKYVVQNNMVRRSNTLNPNIPQQQQQQNQAERVKRSNTQNYSNIFNVNTNNPRRNNTINVSSSTGQRNYPNINTFRNFEQYYNQPRSTNNNNTRVKELSPLQIQRNKMKSEFTFPNGERFTPRQDEKVNTSIPPPTPAMTHTSFQSNTSNTSNQSQPSRVNIPTENQTLKRSNSKKFGSFWKKIMGKESKDERLPKIQITPVQPKPEPLSNQPQSKPTPSAPSHLGDSASSLPMLTAISSADQQDFDSSKLIERLQHQWEIIHQDSSISQTTQDSIIESYLPKTNVSFSNEIFVNETYSSQEYDRADPEEVTPVKDRKLVFDNEFGFIDEVKYGLNQYKRNEMMIHKDSIKYVQFCK